MKQVIFIAPIDIDAINAVADLGNSPSFLEHLKYVDYHYLFFSTLYQSGIDYFETNLASLPKELVINPFWHDRFLQLKIKTYDESFRKAQQILINNFSIKIDQKYRAPQFFPVLFHFATLFYSLETNTPFISTQFVTVKDLEFLEDRFSKELYNILVNFYSLVSTEEVQTIIPRYSVLKKDMRRFEDIAASSLFKRYSDSLKHLPIEVNSKSLIKNIEKRAILVYNKYASSLDLKTTTFNLIKSNKKVLDLFTSKITSIFGDVIIESIEKTILDKRVIHFYGFKDAFMLRLFAERLNELQKAGGKEALMKSISEAKKQKGK